MTYCARCRCLRPARTYPGLRNRFGDFDLVVVRENTEGFYADRNMEQGNGDPSAG